MMRWRSVVGLLALVELGKGVESNCRPMQTVFVVLSMHRAGLSSRLERLTQAIQVAMSLRAGLVMPSPCSSLGGHGRPSCHGELSTWDGYIDIDKFESIYATKYDNQIWRPLCQKFLHLSDPWPSVPHVSLTPRGKDFIDWSLVRQAQNHSLRQGFGNMSQIVYTIRSHKVLTQLSHQTHRTSPISVNALHSGDFPIAKHLEEEATHLIDTFFHNDSFYAVKVRRGDKLDRGFYNCTKPESVAEAVASHLPFNTSIAFVMSDEDMNSTWWSNLSLALHQTSLTTVVTEVEAIQKNPNLDHLDGYARYLLGLALLHRANGILVTQNHGTQGAAKNTAIDGFLCEANYVHHHQRRSQKNTTDISKNTHEKSSSHRDDEVSLPTTASSSLLPNSTHSNTKNDSSVSEQVAKATPARTTTSFRHRVHINSEEESAHLSTFPHDTVANGALRRKHE